MAKKKTTKVKETGKESSSALERVVAQIEKQYGQGAIMQMDENKHAQIDCIPTGAISLDLA